LKPLVFGHGGLLVVAEVKATMPEFAMRVSRILVIDASIAVDLIARFRAGPIEALPWAFTSPLMTLPMS